MQMKPNNLDQTINQVPKEWGINIPDSIEENCKSYYHVLMVKRTHIPEQETYRTTAYVSQYVAEAWNKKGGIKENLPILGYSKFFILHDPTKPEVKAEPVKKAGRPKKEESIEE